VLVAYCRYSTDNFLPLGLTPGPRAPVDLASFYHPLLDELRLLREGVPAYDAHTDEAFFLKAHLVLVTGDSPAIAKLMSFSGHSARFPCRACKIDGTAFKITHRKKNGQQGETTHYYFPLLPPTRFPSDFAAHVKSIYRHHPSYTVDDLPLRTPDNYQEDAFLDDPSLTGVKGISPLSLIPTIQVPYSCPFDVMHLVYLGFVRDLCRLLSGSYFKKESPVNHRSPISKSEWEQLGKEMGMIEAPSNWGRPPRDISKHINGLKAEDCSNFLTHYMLPLIHGRVDDRSFTALQQLVLAMSLAISYEIESTELHLIDNLLKQFSDWFYSTFYRREYDYLQVCKYTIHALLHIPREIRNWGPASYFWQYAEVS